MAENLPTNLSNPNIFQETTSSASPIGPKPHFNKKPALLLIAFTFLSTVIAGFFIFQQVKPQVKPPIQQSTSSLPSIQSSEDAQKRLEIIASRLTDPSAAKTYQEALRDAATYTNPNRPPAIVEVQRGGKYAQVFSDLTGQYYATRDLEILALAQQLRSFIKEKYPVTYNGRSQSEWEIQGE